MLVKKGHLERWPPQNGQQNHDCRMCKLCTLSHQMENPHEYHKERWTLQQLLTEQKQE